MFTDSLPAELEQEELVRRMSAPESAPAAWYAAALEIDYPDRELNRLTTFLRPLAFIPIGILLALLSGPTTLPTVCRPSKSGP
jgi:hypothetical protein